MYVSQYALEEARKDVTFAAAYALSALQEGDDEGRESAIAILEAAMPNLAKGKVGS